jgi:hypothetical protein
MQSFKKLSEVDQSVADAKSDDDIPLFLRLHAVGFVIDMEEMEEPKGY